MAKDGKVSIRSPLNESRHDRIVVYGAADHLPTDSHRRAGCGAAGERARQYRYATRLDYLLLVLGGIFSLAYGFLLPCVIVAVEDISDAYIKAEGSFVACDAGELHCNETAAAMVDYSPDDLIASANSFLIALVFVGIYALVTSYLQMICITAVSERQAMKLRQAYMRALFRQELSWFESRQSGEILNQFFEEIERVRDALGEKYGFLLSNTAQIIGCVVVAFYFNFQLAVINIILVIISVTGQSLLNRKLKHYSVEEQECNAKSAGVVNEVVSCIRTVHAFNGQQWEARRYERTSEAARQAATWAQSFAGLVPGFIIFTTGITRSMTFWYGGALSIDGSTTTGAVMGFIIVTMMMSRSLSNALPMASLVNSATTTASPIFQVIDREPAIVSGANAMRTGHGVIEFRNVSFSYPSRPLVKILDNFSLTVHPGETVAIVGPSGGGKSTVCKLLLRLYDATKGEIRINGQSIRSLGLEELRRAVGVVAQEPVLFNDTIEQNVRVGNELTLADIDAALNESNAAEFIDQLPLVRRATPMRGVHLGADVQGWGTPVGERGAQLSGGQKQRIAIARALARRPRVLILDEATSALDVQTEAVLQEAMKKGAEERVTLVIAHRLATVRTAAKIVVLGEGRVQEVGTHDELIANHGAYFELVQAQHFASDRPKVETERSQVIAGQASESESSTSYWSSATPRREKRSRLGERLRLLSLTERDAQNELLENEVDEAEMLVEEKGEVSGSYRKLLSDHRPPKLSIALSGLCCIMTSASLVALPFVFAGGMKGLSKPPELLLAETRKVAIIFLFVGVVQALSEILVHCAHGLWTESIGSQLKVSLFRNIVKQDIEYFDSRSTGEITARFSQHAPAVKRAFNFVMNAAFLGVFMAVVMLFIVVIVCWQMVLFLVALILLLLPFKVVLGRVLGSGAREHELVDELGKTVAEAVDNVATLQAMTCEAEFCAKIDAQLRELLGFKMRQTNAKAIVMGFANASAPILFGLIFWFGSILIAIGATTAYKLFLLIYAFNSMSAQVTLIALYFPVWRAAKTSGRLIAGLLEQQPTIDATSTVGMRLDLSGKIQFRHVYFSYPMRPDTSVLNGVRFKVKPGHTLAIVGASGSGKSTVVSLLERFYDPHRGEILLDGVDSRSLNIQHMRQQVTMVGQEPVLFDVSLWENIVYGLADYDEDDVIQAAKCANIHDFICNLPQGYETRAGDKGAQLSGGQKQRVAIARCLVRQPKVLLLDEATSALDSDSEKVVQQALDAARVGRTCIVIAHRLSTIQNADNILVMKNGFVIESGSHQSLMDRKGAYYDMVVTSKGEGR